ncbi:MAG TPA: ferritin-like domain-containing protein [Saprospiraceae bacterium]|nr:ferritin-like domain-containing protein [Saprospiraceae bacterium]
MKTSGLRDLFEDQLKDIYWAEKALTKAIPEMIKNASSPDLVDALNEHLGITEQQVARCEEVFASMNMKAVGKKCEAMEGLIKEATEIMSSTTEGSVRDAGIICAAQKVEHYEIATYGTLAAFAKQLGESKAVSLLEKTLSEEKEADVSLTKLAEAHVNEEAELETK